MPLGALDSTLFADMFGTEIMRAVFDDRAFLARCVEVEAALARAEARLGMIPAAAAETISRVAMELVGGAVALDVMRLKRETETVGYPILPLVRQIAALCGEAGRWVHWGATTQDIMDTALVLQIRAGLAVLEQDLATVRSYLCDLARRHRLTPMAGRTHLQHALPITFGYKAAVWLAALDRHALRFQELRPRVLLAEFGGAAGTLASLDASGARGLAVRAELARELELGDPPITWHAARDGIAETVQVLALLGGSLGKIAFDIMLMSATEFGEAAGLALDSLVADFERATGPWHVEWVAVPEAFGYAAGALNQARFMLSGLVVDTGRMAKNLGMTHGLIVAEAVMMGLAPHIGRNAAHDLVYDACQSAIASGRPLIDVLLEIPAILAPLGAERLKALVDPKNYLGAAPAMVDRVLASR